MFRMRRNDIRNSIEFEKPRRNIFGVYIIYDFYVNGQCICVERLIEIHARVAVYVCVCVYSYIIGIAAAGSCEYWHFQITTYWVNHINVDILKSLNTLTQILSIHRNCVGFNYSGTSWNQNRRFIRIFHFFPHQFPEFGME